MAKTKIALISFLFVGQLFASSYPQYDKKFHYQKRSYESIAIVEYCTLGHYSMIDGKDTISQGFYDLTKEMSYRTIQYNNSPWALEIFQGRQRGAIFFTSEKKAEKFRRKLKEDIRICEGQQSGHEENPVQAEETPLFSLYPEHSSQFQGEMTGSLLSGQESFQMRAHSILEAKKSLFIQGLNFMADEAGRALGELIINKRREEHIDITVISDPVANFTNFADGLKNRFDTPRLFHNMMSAGIMVHGYNCNLTRFTLRQLAKSIETRRIDPLKGRVHEKIWLVDNDYAILGGMNITSNYFRLTPEGESHWRDQDILFNDKKTIEDLSLISLANIAFFEKNYPSEHLACFNPHKPGTAEFEEFYHANKKEYREKGELEEDAIFTQNTADKLLATIQDRSFTGPQTSEITKAKIIHHRPKIKETYIEEEYVRLIDNAKTSVVIANAYLMPPKNIEAALMRAAHRGVNVTLLSNSLKTNDLKPVTMISRLKYKRMLEANISIYEWTGINPQNNHQKFGLLHAKMMVVDSKNIFIGSYNLDSSSLYGNSEIGISLESVALGEQLHQEIIDDLVMANKVTYQDALRYYHPVGLKRLTKKPVRFFLRKIGPFI